MPACLPFRLWRILPLGLPLLLALSCEKKDTAPVNANVERCRITRQTIKRLVEPGTQGPLREVETVAANGEAFQVSLEKEIFYTYDSQGRLVLERILEVDGKYDSVRYNYQPGHIIAHSYHGRYESEGFRHYKSVDTLGLNTQGLANKHLDMGLTTYDSEGYLIKAGAYHNAVIVDGNIDKIISMSVDWDLTFSYDYDHTKANLPNPKPFYGKQSRNRPTHMKLEIQKALNGAQGLAYTDTYLYQADANGLVKRQITYRKKFNIKWFYQTYHEVHDFEYECP